MMKLSRSAVWDEIEKEAELKKVSKRLQRLVMKSFLFRVYAAVNGLTFSRMLLLEIPESHQKLIEAFHEPQGLNVWVEKTGQEKSGCITCVIESTMASKNDIFTVVADDILLSLYNVNQNERYTETICQRLDKWKNFFKNRKKSILSEEQIIGLIGELEFLQTLLKNGVNSALSFWNGPLEASQDFQSATLAVEIKTTCATLVNQVRISSLSQLDIENRKYLFLVVYKLERTKSSGVSLSEKIAQVYSLLNLTEQKDFNSKLQCMGYFEENEKFYTEKYSFRNCWAFSVEENFPKLIKTQVPIGIYTCSYQLSLDACNPFQTNVENIISKLEDIHGENR